MLKDRLCILLVDRKNEHLSIVREVVMTIDYSKDKTGRETNTAAENREAQNTEADLSSASFSGTDLQQYRDDTVIASDGVVIKNTVPEEAVPEEAVSEEAVSEALSDALSADSVSTTVIYHRDGSMTLQAGSEPNQFGNKEKDRVVGEAGDSPGPSGPHSYSGPLGIEGDNLAGRDAGRSEEFTITVRN